ncbi:MAG: methyltransferase domain-containing protein [Actinomycetota bacterium]
MERTGGAEHRERLLADLSGRVVEVGAGNGLNFAHYPSQVTEVVAVEPEPRLRAAAQQAALETPVPVRVVGGVAGALPVAADAFDAGVASLVLCSVADQPAALAELYRVIGPGGQLRFYEHVAAEPPGVLGRVQKVADATLWPRLFGGCHTGRDTVAAITEAGFVIEELDRFRFPAGGPPQPASPHVLGRATKP